MNILDENIVESQRQLLRGWRISIRQIGHEIGRKGMKDEAVIPFLLTLRRPTFFTRDLGFHKRANVHPRYCLVCLAVKQSEAAHFVRRALKHPQLNTQAKRMGLVVQASHTGISVWRLHTKQEVRFPWEE